MSIIHKYILRQVGRTLALSLGAFVFLFLVFDFFDRIDNILPEDAPFWMVVQYFALKVPLMVSLMLPVSMLVSVMLSLGILSKNSEITAMRASGLTVFWIARPVFVLGLLLSVAALFMNETLVPYCARRTKEIYNIDIRKKNETGSYSQSNFWWRSEHNFYSVGMFDSRTNTLLDFSWFELGPNFDVLRRLDAARVKWINEELGWSMEDVNEYRFSRRQNGSRTATDTDHYARMALPLKDSPQDFYDVRADPHTMSYRELKRFIREQRENGVEVRSYLADLYEKISFPLIILIVVPVVLPFALKPARTGSMALSFLAGLIIAFAYYAVHSFSLSLGRAEIWPPILAAWMANIIMGFVGLVLSFGAESPT
jgi:lipopolysaccharide export system permease protein